jgi:PhnB protein
MHLNAYLNFDGDCRAAFEFYAKCLGGKIEMMLSHGESPVAEQTPAGWRDKIMHARLVVGDQMLMGSDSPPEHHEKAQGFAVSIIVDEVKEAERIFQALSDQGTVRMALQETFWAQRFGMLTDRFGTPWMVNCPRPME